MPDDTCVYCVRIVIEVKEYKVKYCTEPWELNYAL